MIITHEPLIYLFNTILNDSIRLCINNFILSVTNDNENYETQNLWIEDQKIGGMGGYAIPPNPVKNPFPCGIERSLYRPLQYARSDIDLCDIRFHARYVIQNSGMHLETICRLVLREYKVLGNLRFNNTTLGKSIQLIKKLNIFSEVIITGLENFDKIYNLSKHEVNQDESRERLFNAFEAITAYFSARVIGIVILRKLCYPRSNEVYKIIKFQDKDFFK